MTKLRVSFALSAIALSLTLHGCSSPRQPELATHDPDTLAASLVTATREFCVPYVVDGASVSSLTGRAGVSEEHYDVNGKDVTRYFLDQQPGQPLVTFSDQDYCAIWLYVAPSIDRTAVDAAFRRDLRLDGWSISEAQNVPVDTAFQRDAAQRVVSCVRGRSDALITFSQSQPGHPLYVRVRSEERYCGQL